VERSNSTQSQMRWKVRGKPADSAPTPARESRPIERCLCDATRELWPGRYRRAVGSARRTPSRCTLELEHVAVKRDFLNDPGWLIGESTVALGAFFLGAGGSTVERVLSLTRELSVVAVLTVMSVVGVHQRCTHTECRSACDCTPGYARRSVGRRRSHA
jgi:hypothetical protein